MREIYFSRSWLHTAFEPETEFVARRRRREPGQPLNRQRAIAGSALGRCFQPIGLDYTGNRVFARNDKSGAGHELTHVGIKVFGTSMHEEPARLTVTLQADARHLR